MSGTNATVNSPGMKRIVAILEAQGPLNADEIAEEANLSPKTVKASYLPILVAAGKVHVFRYQRNTASLPKPEYRAGPDPRKHKPKRPKALTPAEKAVRWKEKTGYSKLRQGKSAAAASPFFAEAAGYRITNNERRKKND